jgi:LacI family transcriptional regulator
VKVPDDVSVIGFDDLPMSAMMDPPLTTMKVSQQQIGQLAIQSLLGRINGSLSAPTIKINIGGQLICRKSVKTL